jgi:23S rRNA (cytidine1920-2'-O)/16S rRNA (cytidine1409-2'-O)-methyltransferase
MASKQRLDVLVLERGLAATREKARGMIMAGEVLVNGRVADKPGMQVSFGVDLEVKSKPQFVSRGGLKLAHALEAFQASVVGLVCADVGASTGGFTDCLLQNGAAKVYALDVGYGQIDLRLRSDPRVVVMERVNARYVDNLPVPVQFATIDASFISLRLLLPVVKNWLSPAGSLIPLIKPQFEAGPSDVGKGGVVRDSRVHRRVLLEVLTFAASLGFAVSGLTTSPIKGPAGNMEFLSLLSLAKGRENFVDDDLVSLVNSVVGVS